MNSVALSNQLIQYAASSIYICLILSIIIEASFKFFRINEYRFRATARLLLPLKLVIDPLTLLWSKKWMLINANIFGCAHPLQRYISNKMCGCANEVDTLMGKVFQNIPVHAHQIFIAFFIGISAIRLFLFSRQYLKSWMSFRKILTCATPILRPVHNLKLAQALSRYKCALVSSRSATAPFAGFGNVIVLPQSLLEVLSQEEFEAVLSHELEHLKWSDSASRFFCQLVAALCWWIPLKRWFKAVEHDQELACDYSINSYDINGFDLASALKKSLREQIHLPENCPAFTDRFYLSGKENLMERFRMTMLPIRKPPIFSTCLAAALMFMSSLVIGYNIC